MTKPILTTILSSSLIVATANAEVNFEKEVLPLLEKSCNSCHKAPYEEDGKIQKPKAGLRFDGAWAILAGGENGKVLTPGKPDDSEMYWRTTLPADDDDFMPPKGDVWSEADKKVVALWIKEGAKFGGWEGNLEGKPVVTAEVEKKVYVSETQVFYEKLSDGLKPAAEAEIAKVTEAGGNVMPLAVGNPLLNVDFIKERDNTTDEKVASIGAIGDNVAKLYLSRTPITDAGLAPVSELPRLTWLDLHETEIGDEGLKHLTGLKNLTYLNLHHTKVTDKGVAQLAKIKTLKSVYLWKSGVTEAGVKKLQKQLPDAKVNWK